MLVAEVADDDVVVSSSGELLLGLFELCSFFGACGDGNAAAKRGSPIGPNAEWRRNSGGMAVDGGVPALVGHGDCDIGEPSVDGGIGAPPPPGDRSLASAARYHGGQPCDAASRL